uniref:Uncharacterized protein n=1 Tax=Peronospora matthiolae TaxID=2874970 RepID=A0AAV1V5C7_9STRA
MKGARGPGFGLEDAQPLAKVDALSTAAAAISASPVAAEACGGSPRADDDGLQGKLICSGKLDGGSDLK